jgi:hypothetical protein
MDESMYHHSYSTLRGVRVNAYITPVFMSMLLSKARSYAFRCTVDTFVSEASYTCSSSRKKSAEPNSY